MTAVPLGASLAVPAVGKPYGRRLQERYREGGGLLPPGLVAEEVVKRWSLARADLDAWALTSLTRARRAQRKRLAHLVGVGAGPGPAGPAPATVLARDEALSPSRSLAELSSLAPMYVDGGAITSGNMAAEGDGASALLIAAPQRALDLGLTTKAAFISFAVAGGGPEVWPVATVAATSTALRRAGLRPGDVDRFEVHESSAAAVLAWMAEMGVGPSGSTRTAGPWPRRLLSERPGPGCSYPPSPAWLRVRLRYALVCSAGEGGVATACVLGRA